MWLSTFFSVDQRRTLKVFRYSSRYPAELDWKGKILKLTEDTLVIKRKGVRGRTIYIKSKDQSSPLKPALNPYNRRAADYGVSVDSLLEMAYSLYCTYREKEACPDTMLLLVKLKLNEEGKVVMAKYKCTPPDSATYADFYNVFCRSLKVSRSRLKGTSKQRKRSNQPSYYHFLFSQKKVWLRYFVANCNRNGRR